MDPSEILDALKHKTEIYAEELPPDGDWSPMLFVFKDDKVTTIGIEMPPNELRDWWFGSVIPNLIKKEEPEPDAVAFLVSSWVRKTDPDEDPENLKMMPSEDPNRSEAVIISVVSKEEELFAMGRIVRSDGPPVLEWEREFEAGGRAVGGLRRGVWP